MALPPIRYPLDPTGTNRDNLVAGEVHTLSAQTFRVIAPTYGPFFGDSTLRVYDASTNQALNTTQYRAIELLQDASLKFGKPIFLMVLILDPNVSNQVAIDYQVLGGAFQNNAKNMIDMYQAILNDNRPVDWVNVQDKPTEFPPVYHRHLLDDVYGFESIVASLERLRNAIILSDVPAYEALMDWVDREILDLKNSLHVTKEQVGLGFVENLPVITGTDMNTCANPHKYMTFDNLLPALQALGIGPAFNVKFSLTLSGKDVNIGVSINTKNVFDNSGFYWSVEPSSKVNGDFSVTTGVINVTNQAASFSTKFVNDGSGGDSASLFRVILRAASPNSCPVFTSRVVSLAEATSAVIGLQYMLDQNCSWIMTGSMNGGNLFAFVNGTCTLGFAQPTKPIVSVAIAQPSITSPANGSTDTSTSITLQADAFATITGVDTQAASEWQLSTDAGFTTLMPGSGVSSTSLNSIAFTGLSDGQTYYARVRYTGASGVVSYWSSTISFVVSLPVYTPPPTTTASISWSPSRLADGQTHTLTVFGATNYVGQAVSYQIAEYDANNNLINQGWSGTIGTIDANGNFTWSGPAAWSVGAVGGNLHTYFNGVQVTSDYVVKA